MIIFRVVWCYIMYIYMYIYIQGPIYKHGDSGQKYFSGPPSPQTKKCGWLIDWNIVVSRMVEYGLMASC